MGPGTLQQILGGIHFRRDDRLLVGIETADDAGVYQISDDLALIQTVDFFTPMVDDPYLFGQIAAANALSDVYAMGGRPLTAMNIVCYPQCGDLAMLTEIIRGGRDKTEEAGALVVGGHTVDDNEPKYGLSVTGTVHPDRVVMNRGACPGDYLYLTKSLGTGIISTGIKAEMASEESVKAAADSMALLNRGASEAMMMAGVNAATDVTGFGLLGHVMEMAEASGRSALLWADSVPMLPGCLDLASMGIIPAGAYNNRDYLRDRIRFAAGLPESVQDLLYAPETSGGLVISVSAGKRAALEQAFADSNVAGICIGRMTARRSVVIEVVRGE